MVKMFIFSEKLHNYIIIFTKGIPLYYVLVVHNLCYEARTIDISTCIVIRNDKILSKESVAQI